MNRREVLQALDSVREMSDHEVTINAQFIRDIAGAAYMHIKGAETGNRKGKVIPKREWVENILNAARITRMKVFMKESLRDLMGDGFRQEFPWEG